MGHIADVRCHIGALHSMIFIEFRILGMQAITSIIGKLSASEASKNFGIVMINFYAK